MNLSFVAMCIEDLRKISKENPNEVIDRAVALLDIFLEKLCTGEIYFEKFSGAQLHIKMIVDPRYEIEKEFACEKIIGDFTYELSKVLSDYENAYGLEPVTYRDYNNLHPHPIYITSDSDLDKQLETRDYVIYKKKKRWVPDEMQMMIFKERMKEHEERMRQMNV